MTLSKKTFREFFQRQKGACYYCGTPLVTGYHCKGGNIEIDHILPFSKSRNSTINNLCLSCSSCNRKKADKSLEQFKNENPEVLYYGQFFFEYLKSKYEYHE